MNCIYNPESEEDKNKRVLREAMEDRRRSLDGCLNRMSITNDPMELENMYAYANAYTHMLLSLRREEMRIK